MLYNNAHPQSVLWQQPGPKIEVHTSLFIYSPRSLYGVCIYVCVQQHHIQERLPSHDWLLPVLQHCMSRQARMAIGWLPVRSLGTVTLHVDEATVGLHVPS